MLLLLVPSAGASDLQLVARLDLPALSGEADSDSPASASADGRFIAFVSDVALTGVDNKGTADVFLHDREADTVTLVSHAFGDLGRVGNDRSEKPKISADGSAVVFESRATDLVDGVVDANDDFDVFVWQRATGAITLVSQAIGGATGDGRSETPFIDGTGARVVFQSWATDLTAGTDANGQADVFFWERAGGAITLASRTAGDPTVSGTGESLVRGLSEDGDTVLIESTAFDLVAGFVDNNSFGSDLFTWHGSTDEIQLVTRSTLGDTVGANGFVESPALSADGSSVVFRYGGTDLILGFIAGPDSDIFQWQRATGEIALVSRTAADPLAGAGGGSFERSGAVSADGSRVAFESFSDQIVEEDSNGARDVFLWERSTGTVQLISRSATVVTSSADDNSVIASISGDGSVIGFRSSATDLVAGFMPPAVPSDQIFVWQEATDEIMLASRSTGEATQASNRPGEEPIVLPDGGAILFRSEASDLVVGFGESLFAFELANQQNRVVSKVEQPLAIIMGDPRRSDEAVVSADGRFVAFHSESNRIIPGFQERNIAGHEDVYLWDRQTDEVTLVSRSVEGPLIGGNELSRDPQISADGNTVVFRSNATDLVAGFVPDPSDRSQLYAWDRLTGEMFLLTRTADAVPTGTSGFHDDGFIKADGSFVVFESTASNLAVPEVDANGGEDIFIWERATDSLTLVSRGVGGTTANGFSSTPRISRDGEVVLFRTQATDLGANDANGSTDVYVWLRSTGELTLVSHVAGDPTTTSSTSSSGVQISADGGTVVYRNRAADVVFGLTPNSRAQIFAWTRATNTSRLVSRSAADPSVGGDQSSDEPQVSADGSRVTFQSGASNLVAGVVDANDRDDVFLWDAASDEVTLISRSVTSLGTTPPEESRRPLFYDNDQQVVFRSRAPELIDGTLIDGEHLFAWDRSSDRVALLSHAPGDPTRSINQNITTVAVASAAPTAVFLSSATDAISGSVPDVQTMYLSGPPSASDLRPVFASAVGPAPVGQIYATTVTVENLSAGEASHAMAVMTLPAGETFVDASGPNWSCVDDGRHLGCRRSGVLPAGGATEPLTIRLVAPATAGSSSIRGIVGWPGVDPNEDNNIATLVTAFAPDDWGDAPDDSGGEPGYPTLAASNGASHGFSSLFLGAAVDVDVDGQPTATAAGDALDGSADEDGIVFVDPIAAGLSGRVEITASAPAFLDAWVDWNADGDWDDAGEKVFDSQVTVAGTQTVALIAPASASLGTTFARFRLSSAGVDAPTGRAADGEVEDYAVDIQSIGLTAQLSAAPTELPDSGLPVTFNVRVDNPGSASAQLTSLVDNRLGSVDGSGTCALPQTLAGGGFYECAYSATVSGIDGTSLLHVLSAGALALGRGLTADDSVNFSFFSVGLDATATATPDEVPDFGGPVTFRVEVTNPGSASAELTALTDDQTGSLDGVGTCDLPQTLEAGVSYACSYELTPTGADGTSEAHVISAGGTALGVALAAQDTATVSFRALGLVASLTADPEELPEAGGDVTFTARVDNPGAANADLTGLSDDQIGSLDGVGSCALPQTLAGGGFYECAYTLSLSGDVGTSETHVISAEGTSLGEALAAQASATVTFFDSVAPAFVGFSTLPDSGDGELEDCETVRNRVARLQVIFDETMATGAEGVDDPASYRLLAPGADFSFETDACGSVVASDVEVPFDVVYATGIPLNDQSTASLVASPFLADGLYRLLVCDGLEDEGGNLLPGGDFGVDFRVDAGNLFVNGHFDCDLVPWQADPDGADVVFGSVDVDGSPQSGSLAIQNADDTFASLGQCVEVAAGVDLDLSFAARLDAEPQVAVGLATSCAFYGGAACSGPANDVAAANLLITTRGEFFEVGLSSTTPAGTVSMACGVDTVSSSGGSWELFLDRARLRTVGVIFSDGFESGDTSAWGAR
ncbi:MAG: GEVED domain-containing protein [Acidobacteriota bacterium]